MKNTNKISAIAAVIVAGAALIGTCAQAEDRSMYGGIVLESIAAADIQAANDQDSIPSPQPAAEPVEYDWFMNDHLCAPLDYMFVMQPTKKDAIGMLKPCLKSVAKTYSSNIKIEETYAGLAVVLGRDSNPLLIEKLAGELKKRGGRLFGYNVAIYVTVELMETGADKKYSRRTFMLDESCSIVDAMFLMQPSKEDAVRMLQPCLDSVSKKYYVPVVASIRGQGLYILVKLGDTDNYQAYKALRDALAPRGNMLFGYPVDLDMIDNSPI